MKTADQILNTMLKYIEDNRIDIDPELIKTLHRIAIENSPKSKRILENEQSMRDMKRHIENAIDEYIKKSKEQK